MDRQPAGNTDLMDLLEDEERDKSVVISDPSLEDNPMIYVSEAFFDHTGYTPEEAIGKNCRFLQGPGTNPDAVEAIRHALKAQTTFVIDIQNYRKDGTPFMNRLRIRPLFAESGELLYYVGAQNPI